MDAGALAALRSSGQFTFKSIEQGAATSVLLATSPQLEGHRRPLLRGLQRGRARRPLHRVPASGVAAYALDPENARRLWELSLEVVG